jgi:hypothetical protein
MALRAGNGGVYAWSGNLPDGTENFQRHSPRLVMDLIYAGGRVFEVGQTLLVSGRLCARNRHRRCHQPTGSGRGLSCIVGEPHDRASDARREYRPR